jgi:hypothetical protein
MNKVSPKGFVEPTEMNSLCDNIRELLADENSLWEQGQRERLQRYTELQRCFTEAEADDICHLNYVFKRKKATEAGRKVR